MKKWLLILVTMLVFLTACGEEEPATVTVTVMTEGSAEYWEEIKTENTEVKVQVVPEGTLVQAVLEAEELPNIVYIRDKNDMEALSDILMDIENKELDGYDMAKFADTNYEEIEIRHASKSGNHYVFPDYKISRDGVERAWLYRRDVFEEMGIKPPETMSELTAACIKLKEEYPKSTPLVIRDGYYGLDLLAPAWKNDASIGSYYDFEKGKWCYGLSEAWAGNFVSHWANMAKNELVPKNYLDMTAEEIDALIAENKAFIVPDYVWKMSVYNKNNGQEWGIMPAPRADIESGQNKIAKRENVFSGVGICEKDDAANTAALKVVDEFFINSCGRMTEESENVRLAQIYTENKINPIRYLTVTPGTEDQKVKVHYQGVLPEFLKGEIPMKRWEAYASQLEKKGIEDMLGRYKSAYSKATK